MSKYPQLEGYETLRIPVSVIYFDRDFNCRGTFTPQSCVELAESMRTKGLKIPIIVQPCEDAEGVPDGYEFRIVAGHRRYTAAKLLLSWSTIPATVITGLSAADARLINLIENLERKDLTLYQEALALRKTFPEKLSYVKMAAAVNKSTTWVRLRCRLLEAPEEIQKLVRQGIIGVADLTQITYKTKEEQLAIAAEVEMASLHGGSIRYRKQYLQRRRARPVRDIDEMITLLMAKGRYPDPLEALAWAAGRMTDEELLGED